MAAAGLEEGLLTKSSTYRCDGYYWRYGRTDAFKCAIYPGHHGNIAVEYALEVSCNCFFFETGHFLGIDKMNDWCRLYGLGEHTGIELSEQTGILAGEEYRNTHPDFCKQNGLGAWQLGDTWQAAIGQSENAFTPLQVSVYIASVINGGTRYAAHLLHSVHDFMSGDAVVEKAPEIINTIPLSPNNVALVRRGMWGVINGSSAANNVWVNFRDAEYEAGGKTGTAQAGSNHSNNGWFTGFAPVNDPQIVVTCMIEHGASGGNSSFTVRKIMDAYLLN
jgi:penicillin-binding protein 2